MIDRRGGGQSRVRPPEFLRDSRHQLREALDVDFVNDGLFPRSLRQAIVAPRERGIHDQSERREGGGVAVVERQVFGRIPIAVTEQAVVPLQPASDGPGIRVQQQLVRIEAMPLVRVVGAGDPQSIQRTGLEVREITVEDVERPLGELDPLVLVRVVRRIE